MKTITQSQTSTSSITNTKLAIAVLAAFIAGGVAFAAVPLRQLKVSISTPTYQYFTGYVCKEVESGTYFKKTKLSAPIIYKDGCQIFKTVSTKKQNYDFGCKNGTTLKMKWNECETTPVLLPDLTIEWLNPDPILGMTRVSFKNIGKAKSPKSLAVLKAYDQEGNLLFSSKETEIPEINPEETKWWDLAIYEDGYSVPTIPNSIYKLVATADSNNIIRESNEENNTNEWLRPINNTLPDLTFSEKDVYFYQSGTTDNKYQNFRFEITNNSNTDVNERFYISFKFKDAEGDIIQNITPQVVRLEEYDDWKTTEDGGFAIYIREPILANSSLEINGGVPAWMIRTHKIDRFNVKLDYDEQIEESDENNNLLDGEKTYYGDKLVDYNIKDIVIENLQGYKRIKLTVENIGHGSGNILNAGIGVFWKNNNGKIIGSLTNPLRSMNAAGPYAKDEIYVLNIPLEDEDNIYYAEVNVANTSAATLVLELNLENNLIDNFPVK